MRLHDRACPDGLAHGLDGSVGGTIASQNEHLALFAMADAYVAFSGALDGIGGSVVRVGVGAYAGLIARAPAERNRRTSNRELVLLARSELARHVRRSRIFPESSR